MCGHFKKQLGALTTARRAGTCVTESGKHLIPALLPALREGPTFTDAGLPRPVIGLPKHPFGFSARFRCTRFAQDLRFHPHMPRHEKRSCKKPINLQTLFYEIASPACALLFLHRFAHSIGTTAAPTGSPDCTAWPSRSAPSIRPNHRPPPSRRSSEGRDCSEAGGYSDSSHSSCPRYKDNGDDNGYDHGTASTAV